MEFRRLVIVTRRTELEELVRRFQTKAQAKFYLERAGEDVAGIAARHRVFEEALGQVRAQIPRDLKVHRIDRDELPQYRFAPEDLVVTVGIDGLVVNVAKYLDGQPIIPVNPDPERIDGILCPVEVGRFGTVLGRTLKGNAEEKRLTMAEARLDDGRRLLAVNDLFIGARSHVSARYRISWNGLTEEQSSSGIIVSTGVGSTGWLRSIYTGAVAIAQSLGCQAELPKDCGRLPWDTDRLVFNVREPFPSKATQVSLVCGLATRVQPLVLESAIAKNGVIFSDGIEADALPFCSGTRVSISPSRHLPRLAIS
jgi:NAD kinase